ncbi:MAG: SIS domain-containing protein [Aigarchaeota archaeon]|nr:SIS domain-containing protein [Candidatus Pelearchaeum maunauluense]
MEQVISSLGYVNRIYSNLSSVDLEQLERLYHDIQSAGVLIPSGEGRSKGALSIACSELAKMQRGKLVVDRGDIGFPGREVGEAAPILKQRFGQVCLLINSGSGRSMSPLLDAQNLAVYIAKTGNHRDYRIDLVTSDLDSPIARLASKYGNTLLLKGREADEEPDEAREFRDVGILEDTFVLGSGFLFHGIAEALYDEALPRKAYEYALETLREAAAFIESSMTSDFYKFVTDRLEARHLCFFAGLGSSHEVARMTAVRIGHIKRAIGDQVFVARETSTPAPRPGDLLIVISNSGETEIVAAWCKNFKRLGGVIAAVVGNPDSTIASMADIVLAIPTKKEPGRPSRFYMQAAFALSPLPIFLVERLEQAGFRLPEYIIRWHQSVTS